MAAREVPDEWRASVARLVEEWIQEHARGERERTIADKLGMTQPTLNQVRNRRGPLGLHVLLQLRAGVGRTVDELLGLPPIEPRPATRPADQLTNNDMRRLKALTSRPEKDAPDDDPPRPPDARIARRRLHDDG
jgi:transcriptional regulator with XRE-family HTH domain